MAEESTAGLDAVDSHPVENTHIDAFTSKTDDKVSTEPIRTGTEDRTEQPTTTSTKGTTDDKGSQKDDDQPIFDPGEFARLTKDLSPELQAQAKALQKSLQGAYTKKFQTVAEQKQKIEAYDSFSSDPVGNLEQMAKRMGYSLSKGGAEPNSDPASWEPNSWDDVMSAAEKRVMAKLSPLLGEFQNIKKNSIESQLSSIDPSWQQYEDVMMQNLKSHPTLAKDPSMLYRLSVPSEVLESRATQKALKRLESKVESGKVSGSSTTTKTPQTGMPTGPVTFQQAVELAQKKLAEEGIRQPQVQI